MTLAQYLAKLGYGTRREAEALLAARRVTTATGVVLKDRDRVPHGDLHLDGVPIDPPPGAVVLLHKPVGYVCSTRDRPPLVYELLSPRFTQRDPVMATIGRLDADTSGLLLLTDDGALNHRLTSPRTHVPKRYEVTLADALRGDEGDLFATGTLMLSGETTPLAAATFDVYDTHRAAVTITEGRYHQVRRMFAAIGHHVTALHRAAFGPLRLDGLEVGAWRVLSDAERTAMADAAQKPTPRA